MARAVGGMFLSVCVVALLTAPIGCAGGAEGDDAEKLDKPAPRAGPPPSSGPRHVVWTMRDEYLPRTLTIEAGDRIAFENRSKFPHTAKDDRRGYIDPSPGSDATDHSGADVNYASAKGFATHALLPGEAQIVVFRVARTYRYHCSFHPDMKGVVKVVTDTP